MKIRECPVTNSSSSSFVVSFKNGNPTKEELDEKLDSLFDVGDNNILGEVYKDIFKALKNGVECSDVYLEDDLGKLCKEYSIYDDERDRFDQSKMLIEYGNVRVGCFGNDEGGVDEVLCNSDVNFEDDDIVFKHNGGY